MRGDDYPCEPLMHKDNTEQRKIKNWVPGQYCKMVSWG